MNSFKSVLKKRNTIEYLVIKQYDDEWKQILDCPVKDKRLVVGASTDRDNAARKSGFLYDGASLEKFEQFLNW